MAGDYLQWVIGLVEKRETLMMASLLKRCPEEIAARLMKFWEWCDANIPESAIDRSGAEPSFDAVIEMSPTPGDNKNWIDGKLGIKGGADAMSKTGWLKLSGRKIILPGYGRNNGMTAKTRGRNTRNKRNSRQKSKKDVTDQSPNNGDVTETKTVTRGSKDQRPKTREERIETKTEDGAGVLMNLSLEELKQPPKLLARYKACMDAGLCTVTVPGGAVSLLRFFGAAERAIELGEKNPCGFFYAIVMQGLWDQISDGQELRAAKKLKALDRQQGGPR